VLDENIKDAQISIYELSGKKIKSLFNGFLPKGEQLLDWNLTDNGNNKVPHGMYLLKINSESSIASSVILVN